jgi:hypothetical protein
MKHTAIYPTNGHPGELVHLEKDQTNDTWLAATTSLGLLGVIARVKLTVYADFKIYANQTVLDEDEVLNGDIYAQISPYVTANYWVCSFPGSSYVLTSDIASVVARLVAFPSILPYLITRYIHSNSHL